MLNGLRRAVSILLALSADSPFSQGGPQRVRLAPDGDLPGVPAHGHGAVVRRLRGQRRRAECADRVGCAAGSELSVVGRVACSRCRGRVEVRVMDAQSTVADSAALVVLVQPLARAHLDRRQAHGATRRYGPGMLTRVVARRSHAGRIVRGYPWRALTARADAQSRAAAEGSVEAGRGLCGQLD